MSVARETVPAVSAGRMTQASRVARQTGDPQGRFRPLQALLLLPIRLYRRFLSPALGARCRYYPTCSAYAEQSIRELGAFRGAIVAAWRLLRCNPLSSGGLDPVAERRLFRDRGAPSDGGDAT